VSVPGDDVDTRRIIARIREALGPRLGGATPGAAEPPLAPLFPADEPELQRALARLAATSDMLDFPITSHRALLARPIILAKRFLRQLLRPALERQAQYNRANAYLVRQLYLQLTELRRSPDAAGQALEGEPGRPPGGGKPESAAGGAP
jgi:hypothetical protein